MTKELISVIVPVYNVGKYLSECLDSICEQSYEELQIILFEDCSTDSSLEICTKYQEKDSRIEVVRLADFVGPLEAKNVGLSEARNVGLSKARGKYVTFIDSDDYISRDYIETLYGAIKESDADMSVCSYCAVRDKENVVAQKEEKQRQCLNAEQAFNNLLLRKGISNSAWAKMYKRELFRGIKFPKGKIYEDMATTYKLIDRSSKIIYVDKECYFYRVRSGSLSQRKEFTEKEYDLIIFADEMCDYLSWKYEQALEIQITRYRLSAYFSVLRKMVLASDRDRGREKELVEKIKKQQIDVFRYRGTPKRDKFAIVALNCGLPFFKVIWLLYCKTTGRTA